MAKLGRFMVGPFTSWMYRETFVDFLVKGSRVRGRLSAYGIQPVLGLPLSELERVYVDREGAVWLLIQSREYDLVKHFRGRPMIWRRLPCLWALRCDGCGAFLETSLQGGGECLSCVVVEGLSDTEALIWSLQDEHTSLPLSDEEYYEAVVELRRRLGSLRRVAETLGEPFESIRGLVEKMEGRRVLEDEGIQVVDKRTKQAISLKGVKKTTAAQFIKAVKRLSKLEKKKTAEQEKEEAAPSPTLPSPEEAVKMLEWQPKLFKAVEQGPFLHEQLKRPETLLSAPRDVRALMELVSPDNTPFPSYFPVVRLNPPFDNIRVLLCPRCLSLLRGLGHGSLVACLECGFPNHDVWKAV